MKKKKIPTVEIRNLKAGRLHGCMKQSSAETRKADIPELSTRYHEVLEMKPGHVLPLYVITKDRDAAGKHTLFIGGEKVEAKLDTLSMPEGPYARRVIRPKFSIFWAPAINEAKQWFFGEWLPASNFEFINLEFELHSEKSVGKMPTLELFFAMRKKGE